jgi:hypothetical protein
MRSEIGISMPATRKVLYQRHLPTCATKPRPWHIWLAGLGETRHEIDATQKLNYHAIALVIADLGYAGFVAHEFTPNLLRMTTVEI